MAERRAWPWAEPAPRLPHAGARVAGAGGGIVRAGVATGAAGHRGARRRNARRRRSRHGSSGGGRRSHPRPRWGVAQTQLQYDPTVGTDEFGNPLNSLGRKDVLAGRIRTRDRRRHGSGSGQCGGAYRPWILHDIFYVKTLPLRMQAAKALPAFSRSSCGQSGVMDQTADTIQVVNQAGGGRRR